MRAEGVGKAVTALKDLSHTVALLGAVVFGCYLAWSQPHRIWFQRAIDDLGVVEIAGVKFAHKLTDALNKQQRERDAVGGSAKRDVAPVLEVKTALEMLPSEESFWVYLGNFKIEAFTSPPNFEIRQAPKVDKTRTATSPLAKPWDILSKPGWGVGTLITASQDVFKRAREPFVKGEEWYLGKVTGVASKSRIMRITALGTPIVDDDGSYDLWINATDDADD